ncbi:Type IV secretion system protein virB6, partial [Xanthomonas euvesicatoria]|nr:Type IV secretion system protein virB6 [Xanthomonas euvesicatoria]
MPTAAAAWCAPRAANWYPPLTDANLGDFVLFKLVNDYFNSEIQDFGM